MKLVFLTLLALAPALILSSCSNTSKPSSNQQVNTGPFDKYGRYREDWADDPSKWQRSGGTPSPHELKSDRLPQIASRNDEPPPNSNPLPPAPSPKTVPVIARAKTVSQPAETPREVVVKSTPATKRTTSDDDDDDDRVVHTKPKPKTVVAKAKPKTKPKPKSVRYVVKKGDSLSLIASRTGSSVSAIRGENGISGSLIRPGQSLVIPKR